MLDFINNPSDLTALTPAQLTELAAEIRGFLVEHVSKTGGHLGPNLGVVELTIALHRVFESPKDTIVFDTGHQSYVHKILTGRHDFTHLRQQGGLSGYPSRRESRHDVVENSHASTGLSWADGVAKANHLLGHDHKFVVAVVGDGALTGGMSWEALNNIAESNLPIVIVVNDNGRSYSPTIGGMAHHLDTLRTTQGYEAFMNWISRALARSWPGRAAYQALRGIKRGIKDIVAP
ncbi:MAG: thiamine pyrophosphate-dependent enzyme, partial [Promicromonosporaceae bacterium]|nr:thiamine pyrophosphate-dependent enzyme [Promicromonosporaceae bacterium]